MRSFLCLLVLAGCCDQQNCISSKYYEDGRQKPHVVLTALTSNITSSLPWNVAHELEETIRSKISKVTNVYLSPSKKSPISGDPFGTEVDWIKNDYNEGEFVTFLQLVQHETVTCDGGIDRINVAFMLRVVDIRNKPKVILQQLVKCSHPSISQPDYSTIDYENENYRFTPLAFCA